MNTEDFEKLKETLTEAGYRNWGSCIHGHEDYCIGKAFHREDNKWEPGRSGYQIAVSVYEWGKKDLPNIPEDMRKRVGLEVTILVSRTIDERMDLVMPFRDDMTVDEMEKTAESFYNWVCSEIPEPPVL